jgi:hypothetical protein
MSQEEVRNFKYMNTLVICRVVQETIAACQIRALKEIKE